MIVKLAGSERPRGVRVRESVSTACLLPTVMQLLGAPVPEHTVQGVYLSDPAKTRRLWTEMNGRLERDRAAGLTIDTDARTVPLDEEQQRQLRALGYLTDR
jgi:hypothetical protein